MILSTADEFFIFMTFDEWIPLMSQLHGGDEMFIFPWNSLCTANDLDFFAITNSNEILYTSLTNIALWLFNVWLIDFNAKQEYKQECKQEIFLLLFDYKCNNTKFLCKCMISIMMTNNVV